MMPQQSFVIAHSFPQRQRPPSANSEAQREKPGAKLAESTLSLTAEEVSDLDFRQTLRKLLEESRLKHALSSWLLLTYLILNSMLYCLLWTDESAEEDTGGVWQEGGLCSDLSYSGHLGTLQVTEWKDRTMICRSENVELIYATGQKLEIINIFWKKTLLFTHGCFYIIKRIDYSSLQYNMMFD